MGFVKGCFYFLWDKAAGWYSMTDFSIITVGAALGGFLSWGLGGFDGSVKALSLLMMIDFATGSYAATRPDSKEGLSSRVGFWGLVKKVSVIGFIMFGHLVDHVMSANMVRNMLVCGFGLNEVVSIFENLDRCGKGHWIPRWLRTIIEKLRDERGFGKYEKVLERGCDDNEKN